MNAQPEIPGFLDRRPLVWSYSLLNAFRNNCAYNGEATYITKTVKYVETPARKIGNDGHKALELRVGGGKPLPEQFRHCEPFAKPFDGKGAITEAWYQVDTEGRACDRNSPKKFGHGKIDLVLIEGDKAYINDWKFAKVGNSRYEDPFELACNAVLLKGKYPQLTKIVGTYTWINEGKLSQLYDVSDVDATWNEICSILQTVYNYRSIGEFPKKTGPLCAHCHRFDCDENSNPDKP